MTTSDGTPLRIGVMGAGAVGGYFGARLAQAGAAVTLIGRPAHVEAVNRSGLELSSGGTVTRVRMAATPEMSALSSVDVVLVCVKTVDTDAVADELHRVLGPGALVVSLQNGVDNAWRISARVPNPVVAAAVYVSAEMSGPGRLRHNGGGSLIVGTPLGPAADDPRAARAVADLVALFVRAGVPCRQSDDIRVDLWTKLTANCAYNAMSALGQLRYRFLTADAGARDVMRMVVDEIAAVARAEGVPVTRDLLADAVRRIGEVMPEALSSTAQDLALKRRTEIDDLNGFVVKRGEALGVATPVNRTLQALVGLVENARPPSA